MKPLQRVNAAAVSMGAGALLFFEYVLERLGAATTVFSFLPLAWRAALMSEPVLIFASIGLFLLGVGLLWSVAKDTAKAVKQYQSANARSWEFEPEFKAFKEGHRTEFGKLAERQTLLESQVESYHAQVMELLEKLALLENERERTQGHLEMSNAEAVRRAAQEAAGQVRADLLENRDHIRMEFIGQLANLQNEFHNFTGGPAFEVRVREIVSEAMKERDGE